MKQTAIVILNWNGEALLKQFLPDLLKHTPLDEVDIIVTDNGSTDHSISFLETHYPEIIIQGLDKNYGFAEGYNRALQHLSYKYVVLLNSDVEVTSDWFRIALDFLESHPEITALQPKILSYRDRNRFEYAGACGGFIDKNGYPFCRGRILSTVEIDRGQYDTVMPIFWASGACLFIRLKEYWEAGGLDARFFAHQEEIDLCWRLHARGKQIVCLPQSVVYHVGGATLNTENPQKTYLNFRNNLLMIYKNMPDKPYRRVKVVRWIYDYVSAVHFLLQGQVGNARAIIKAHRHFQKMKVQYQAIRKINLTARQPDATDSPTSQSILWEYYFKNKKRFQQL